MNVIIRADASVEIGSGHVIRCLTIADKLSQAGCNVKFWMERLEGNLIEVVKQRGFEHIEYPEQADLYIVDHYALNIEWEKSIRLYTPKIAVIDDLARSHDCDLLLDQNVMPNYETRYDDKLPAHCVKLLGPKYLLIRDEFIDVRSQLRQRTQEIERLLIFMGGSDPTNETMKVLQALIPDQFEHVDIVIGKSNPQRQVIEQICEERGYHFHCQINYMAQLMQQADFAIGAGGATTWERCYVGLPSSATIVADNQREGTIFADSLGVVKNLGWHENVSIQTYRQLLMNLSVEKMSQLGLQLTATDRPNIWLEELLELIK